jgi:hypothetical protein
MTGGGQEAPLLRARKVYHEGCPGCRQERKMEADDRIPYIDFLYIWITCLCAGMMRQYDDVPLIQADKQNLEDRCRYVITFRFVRGVYDS